MEVTVMKEKFEAVEMEIVVFDAEDVIRTSNGMPEDTLPPIEPEE